MPFKKALDRTKADLDAFFADNLKMPIERDSSFKYQYRVFKSDNTLDITEKIVRDIFEADIVICDLSGNTPNPNVMYELGMRFALGHKPVILIREEHAKNQETFDIRGLYTHFYSSRRYKELEEHVLDKLRRFEGGEEVYESPVLKALSKQPQIIETMLKRQVRGIMGSIHQGFFACQELLKRKVCRVVTEGCPKDGTPLPRLPQQPWEIVSFLTVIGAKLPPDFYRRVNFVPPPIPGLLGYLTFHPLAEVVPSTLAKPFGAAMHFFYFHFFAGGHLQEEPTAESYINFALQLGQLHRAAELLEDYLGSESEAHKSEVAQEVLKALVSWVQPTA